MLRSAESDGAIGEAPLTARAASLVYCNDADPGIRRKRAGKGFSYVASNGKHVSDPATLDRIASLAIPPAWTDVWIAGRETCHIQATGRDARGRKQYRYHPRWTAARDEVKFAGLIDFAQALPRLRKQIDADLLRRGFPRERVLATIVWLLDNALIRIGNPAYARDNKSFGLTTLRTRHVEVEGSTLRFGFLGKSGKEWRLRITDRRIARIVRGIQDLPGQHLFQYLDDDGNRVAVSSEDVNDYIRDASGADFTSKHFRTWGATVRAASILSETPTPDTKAGQKRALNSVIDQVAERLGNTRTVCRACYVHPALFDAWNDGRLNDELAEVRGRFRRTPDGLDREEAILLRWLEERKS